MADSPSKNKSRILAWAVYANGTKLNDSFELTHATVRYELNHIGKATLSFNAGNMDKQEFTESDSDLFKPGNPIRLDVRGVDNPETLFEGIILEVRIKVDGNTRSQMIVECRDCAYASTQGRKNRIFEKKKDQDIVKEVLSAYGTVKVDSTECEHPTMVQYYCTDWDFALSRADANGLFILTSGKNISILKPDINASPVLTVTLGVDMISFDGGVSSEEQYTNYEAVSWNPAEQKPIKVSTSSPTLNKQGDIKPQSVAKDNLLLQTDAPTNDGALKQWAESVALKAGLARYQGTFRFYGSEKVIPGCIIELKGLGKRFNGNAFIGSVTHTIENNEWITEAGLGVSPYNITDETDVVTPPASGIVPGLEGIHTGIIKQLQDDPAKESRILVELPWMNGKTKELWARVTTLYATNEGGCLFLPEKGDEVIIGFINQDPSHPVILGSLYGSKHKPPFDYQAENNKKMLVTRSKLRIEFDEEKKIITLLTPGKNQIEINDDKKCIKMSDQNKNEVVMDESGILLSSEKDIVLKAKGNVKTDASAKVEIGAKSDVAINGSNIKAVAQIGFSAKGNATAELTASGQTTIKGAMVMIN